MILEGEDYKQVIQEGSQKKEFFHHQTLVQLYANRNGKDVQLGNITLSTRSVTLSIHS
jgi:hypothetical protein